VALRAAHAGNRSIAAVLIDLLGKIVMDFRVVVDQLKIGILQELRVTVTQQLVNAQANIRIADIALARRPLLNQQVNGITDRLAAASFPCRDGKNIGCLACLQFADGGKDFGIGFELRLGKEG